MSEPGDDAIAVALTEIGGVARTMGRITAAFGLVVIGGLLLAAAGAPRGALIFAGGVVAALALTFGPLYGIAWRRAAVARVALRTGPYLGASDLRGV